VRYARAAGVAGFLVPAKAAEVDRLAEDERFDMVTAVCEESGDTPVIGGSQAVDQPTRLAAARELTRLGCDGILISMPWENDRKTFARDFREIADATDRLIMLQDWDAGGPGLPVDFIAELFEATPNFGALKIEVQPAGPKYSAVLEATGGRLHVSGGWAVMQFIEALDRGVNAFMPTGLHHAYVSIYDLYTQGDRDAARDRFEEILPILAVSNQDMELSLHFFKRLLHTQGLYPTALVREPTREFDPWQARIADEMIARAIALENRLGGVPE
jgi:4-hydroxy-tetrahydrodipicolinate synthase